MNCVKTKTLSHIKTVYKLYDYNLTNELRLVIDFGGFKIKHTFRCQCKQII